MSPADRAVEMTKLADKIHDCKLCRLHEKRNRAVPGAGDVNTEIMFIGEGPGFNEDKQGLPFVGRSGDLLNKMLGTIGMTRDQVFITNVVKCRPPDNRDPMTDEIEICTRTYLWEQIRIIDPLVICTLGRFSMNLFFPGGKITRIHGQPKYENGRAYYPFFHPAAVLRNPSLTAQNEADFQRLLEVIAEVKAQRAAGPAAGAAGGAPPPDDPPDEPPTQMSLF